MRARKQRGPGRELRSLIAAAKGVVAVTFLGAARCGPIDDGDASLLPDADPDVPGDASDTGARVIAVSRVGGGSVLSSIDLDTLAVTADVAPGTVGPDPVVRETFGELFIVNRQEPSNITILDKTTLALVAEIAIGGDASPQDVAMSQSGEDLYVPALGTAGVIHIDRANGNTLTTIDLSELDPDDGLPNCMSAYFQNGEVFVACGILDDADPDLAPRGVGKVAVISVEDHSISRVIDLAGAGPVGVLEPTKAVTALGGDLVIGLAPSTTDFSQGCVSSVPVLPEEVNAASCVISNAALGGYASRIRQDVETLWIAVSGVDAGDNAYGMLRGFDAMNLELWPGQVTPSDQVITDVALCPNFELAVTDQPDDGPAGVRIYSRLSPDERTTAPIEIGLLPRSGNGLACY